MVTKEKIQEWKNSYGEVYEITVTNEDQKGNEIIKGGKKEYKSYHKKIGKKTLSYAAQRSGGMTDPIKFNEAIVVSTFLEGDEEIKTTGEFINAAADQLQEFIQQAEAKVKKL